MKHLKTLGLAAIAALGLMAFVGAGTASATTLATDAAGTIKYPAGTVIHESLKPGTSGVYETTSGSVIATVTKSTRTNKIQTASGTWVGLSVQEETWEEASQTTDTLNLGSLEIMQTAGDAAEVSGKGNNVTFGVFGVSCTYGTGEGTKLGTITGGAAPELVINAVLNRSAGDEFLCSRSVRFTARYVITSPHAVHFVS